MKQIENNKKSGENQLQNSQNVEQKELENSSQNKQKTTKKCSKNEQNKPKTIAKKITNSLILAIFAVVVVILLYVFISLLAGSQPSLFGYQLYYVVTDSMTGTIDKGQVIICKEYRQGEELAKGEIVTFVAPPGFEPSAIVGQKITHRLIGNPYQTEDGKWVVETKGDANSIPDRVPVPLENIRAKYVKTSPFITGMMNFLRHWYGFVALIILPLVAALVAEVVKLIKYKSAVQEEQVKASMQADIDKAVEQALQQAENAQTPSQESEEEYKQRIIQEYLAEQKKDE